MSDLTSLVLTLRAPKDTLMPGWLGRAAYHLFLTLIDSDSSTLATELHDLDGPKPFTCSTLIGGARVDGGQKLLTPEHEVWLRFTGLNATVSEQLQRLAAESPASVLLHNQPLELVSATVDPDEHPWAGSISYEALATPQLLAQEPPQRKLRLNLASPTTFRSGGRSHPIPLPAWTFGSLEKRWNTFSPVQISPELRRFAEACVVLHKYKLETRAVPQKARIERGCVGWAEYAIVRHDRYWESLLNLLSIYSFYSGLGYQTTVGFGQCRPA